MPRRAVSRIEAWIFPLLLIVAAVVGIHWFHMSDVEGAFFVAVLIGWHELDKITDKLDAIAESVESLKGSLEELNAKVD